MNKTYKATKKIIQPEKKIISTDQMDSPRANLFRQELKSDSSLYEAYSLRPYNPDDLWQRKGNYDIFDEMRQDDQIAAVLTLKKFFILNGTREIESDDEQVKEFLEMNLDYFLTGFFDKMLYNILSAIDYGFSITEKIFKYSDIPGFGKKIILDRLKTRAPHPFEFDQDEFGDITKIRQDQEIGSDIEVDPSKVIHYIYQNEFDVPYGQSDLNMGVYRAWWSKNAIIKFWNIYLERFGMPTAVGTYPSGMIQHITDLKNSLKNIQAKTSVIVPEGIKIDLLQAQRGGEGYEKAIDKYNTMIARKMLIPDLLGMSGGETGGGSFALGKSQFDMFYNNIMHERKNLQRVINKEIIFPLVLWNFGSSKYAELKFSQPDQTKRDNDLKLWLEAVNSGKIPITDTHINWFLTQVNAPEIDEQELNEIKEQKEEMREAISGPKDKGNDSGVVEDDEKGDGEKGPDKPEDKEEEKENTKQYSKYYRELTEYEKRIDFAKLDRESMSLDMQYIVQLSKFFKIQINGLIDFIKTKKIIEGKKLDLIGKLNLKGESRFAKIITDLQKDAYKMGYDSAEMSIKKFNLVSSTDVLNNEQTLKAFEQHAFNTASTEYMTILSRVKPILIESIRNGTGTTQTIKMIDEALKGYDMGIAIDNYEGVKKIADKYGYDNIDDMLSNMSKLSDSDLDYVKKHLIPLDTKLGKFRIETIVRTTSSTAQNDARLKRYESLVNDGTIVAYQYSAIMDGRTTPLCSSLDMKIFPVSEAQYYNPPNHYNCRSLLVPIFNYDKYEITDNMPLTEQKNGSFLELKKEK